MAERTLCRAFLILLFLSGFCAAARPEPAPELQKSCEVDLVQNVSPKMIAKLRAAVAHGAELYANPAAPSIALVTLNYLDSVLQADASLADFLTGKALAELLLQINNYEEPIYQIEIHKIFEQLSQRTSDNGGEDGLTALKNMLQERLVPFFTRSQAEKRVRQYLNGNSSLKSALGELDADHIFKHVYGSNPKTPTASSLIGRFLREVSSTLGTQPTTEWRTFFKSPVDKTQGSPRLYASLSQAALPIFKKYFANHHFLFQTHDPGQGTLMVSFNGEVFAYAGNSRFGELRAQDKNSFWPMIVLNSTEGQRAQLYFNLGTIPIRPGMDGSLAQVSKLPWLMGKADKNGHKSSAYCATGAYSCCTHWFGDIPLGEARVSRYLFPSAVDSHARENPNDTSRREGPIGNNCHIFVDGTVKTPPIMQLVWRPKLGNMQLWEVLGLEREQVEAELTNPGYISYAMLSSAPVARVPIVFVLGENNTLPTNNTLKRTISYY